MFRTSHTHVYNSIQVMAAQDGHHYPDLDDRNFRLRLRLSGRSLHLLLIFLGLLLVFLTLLCLYLRRACRRRRGPPECQVSRPGLDPGVIGCLPVVQLHCRQGGHDGAVEECTCSICLSVVIDGEKVKALPGCGHMYHPECVDEWLRVQASCPMCRGCIGEAEQDCGAGGGSASV